MLPPRIPSLSAPSFFDHNPAESSNAAQQSSSATSAQHIAQHWLANSQQRQALQQTGHPSIRTLLPLNPLEQRYQALEKTLDNWINSLPVTEQPEGRTLKKTLLVKKPDQKSLKVSCWTSTLPDFFPHFKALDFLEIQSNSKTLPPSISTLNRLKVLVIKNPELNELPETFGDLRGLSSLVLRACDQFSKFPESVQNLRLLKELNIVESRFPSALPINVNLIQTLKKINIGNSNITNETFKKLKTLKNLEHLFLHQSPFSAQNLVELGSLASLKTLDISTNSALDVIPQRFIEQHPKLSSLSIRYCPNFLGFPTKIDLLKQLQTLEAMHCEALQTIPEDIGQLRKLKTLSLYDCRALRSLPRSVLALPTSCTVNLEETGLSLNILEPLSRHVGGPQIRYSLPPVDINNIGTLEEEAQKWFNRHKQPRNLNVTELNNIAQIAPDSSVAMATLLARFRKTAQYLHQPASTTQRVCGVLTEILRHPGTLLRFCNMAYESNQTCDDRTALGLIEMELAVLESQLMNKTKTLNPSEALGLVVNVGLAIFKQRSLMNIAHEHAKHCKGAVDETEIVLKYLKHLGPILGLPAALNNMLYEQHAWQVTNNDLETAKATVERLAQKESPAFKAFLQKWYPLEVVLGQHDPKRLDQIETQCYETDENLLVEMENARKLVEQLKQANTEHLRNTLAPDTPNLDEVIQTQVENAADVLDATANLNSFKQQREEAHARIWRPMIDLAISLSQNKRPAEIGSSHMAESSRKPRIS
jgi:hypothetical protein